MRLTRRQMLTAGGAFLAATAGRAGLEFLERMDAHDGWNCRFSQPLRILPTLNPVRKDAEADFYEITQKEADVEILPGKRTRIWGYEGMFPGPTIRAQRGRKVVVRQTNQLPVHTVTHLHGGVTEPGSDGFPTDMVMPGQSKSYVYSNLGRGATLWYHDHAMDHTAHNIYMGLAGLYLIEDEHEAGLELPQDEYDVPLILQDRSFRKDGSLAYDGEAADRIGAQGNVILVNGIPWLKFEVSARKYRFRILNGSNATVFRLALNNGQPLVQIATDSGLLPEPVECPAIPLAVAERSEVIIDFSKCAVGTHVILRNLNGEGLLGDIVRFDVVRGERDDSKVPEKLGDIEPLDPQQALRTREFVFEGRLSLTLPPVTWTINQKRFDPNASVAEVAYGQTEIWHLKNRKFAGRVGMVHPVHIHLVSFQVLERNGTSPMPWEQGSKDTVAIDRGEEVKVIMRFDSYRGRYMMHCHNLEHEDHSMMARFDVV